MLSKLAGPFQVKEYFHWISNAGFRQRSFRGYVFSSYHVANAPAAALAWRVATAAEKLLPPKRPFRVESLAGKKIGIVATGGAAR